MFGPGFFLFHCKKIFTQKFTIRVELKTNWYLVYQKYFKCLHIETFISIDILIFLYY